MVDKINVQIRQGGSLLKEITEDNVIIITERACGELFAHVGINEAALLAAQLSEEYDRLFEWIRKTFCIDKEATSDLIKAAKMHLTLARVEVVIEPKKFGDEK